MPAPNQPLYEQVLAKLRKPGLRQWYRHDQVVGAAGRRDVDRAAFRIRSIIEAAQRYVFDAEASAACGVFGFLHLEALAEHVRWLRPLADGPVWIELDNHAILDALNQPDHQDAAPVVGYLAVPDGASQGIMPISLGEKGKVRLPLASFRLTVQPEHRWQGEARARMLRAALGMGLVAGDRGQQAADRILSHIGMTVAGRKPASGILDRVLGIEFDDSAGMMRRLLSAMALLTHRRLISARDGANAPPGMAGPGGAWLAHSTIGLRLPRTVTLARLSEFPSARGNAGPRRRHGVEGHWCWSRRTDLRCAHDWQEERDGMRYRCARCDGARWWRKPHDRGDAERGWVVQTRRVSVAEAGPRHPAGGPSGRTSGCCRRSHRIAP
jgi:hypothetical protein